MLVSTEKSSTWRKVIGQTVHRRPTICSWNYKLINSDTEPSRQLKTVKTKCYILSTSLGQGNTGSIKRLWTKLGRTFVFLDTCSIIRHSMNKDEGKNTNSTPTSNRFAKPRKPTTAVVLKDLSACPEFFFSFFPSSLPLFLPLLGNWSNH